jgi:hypothetical protein
LAETDALPGSVATATIAGMLRRRQDPVSTLDDVVEVLQGIGLALMGISTRLDDLIAILRGEDDEEADA